MQNQKNNNFEIIRMPPQNTNSVVVSSGDRCVIFDPWGRAADWERALIERGLKLHAIYATHAHPDHISAVPELCRAFNVPFYISPDDRPLVGWGNEILDFFGIGHIHAHDVNTTDITPGNYEILPGIKMDVMAAPGHTPGGLIYYFPDEHILLTGDTLFHDGYGRFDFPGGNAQQLFQSIQNIKNLNLPDDTFVVHGHGMDSTIEWLRQNHELFK